MSASASSPFSRLPTELKAKIVKMVDDQDQESSPYVSELSARYKRGLHALAETSRELNALASVNLFRSVLLSEAAEPIFGLLIVPRHGHHFREVVLNFDVNELTLYDVRRAFVAILALPNASTLVVELDDPLLRLLGSATLDVEEDEAIPWAMSPEDEQKIAICNADRAILRLVHAGFRTFASRIKRLEVSCSSPLRDKLLEWCTNLAEFVFDFGDDFAVRCNELFRLFQTRGGLTSLEIRIHGRLERTALGVGWSSASTITSLYISLTSEFDLWAFVRQFINLKNLGIEMMSDEEGIVTVADSYLAHPAGINPLLSLSRLEINVVDNQIPTSPTILAIAKFFTSLRPAPPLLDLILELSEGILSIEHILPSLQNLPPTLRRLDAVDLRYIAPDAYIKLDEWSRIPPHNFLLVDTRHSQGGSVPLSSNDPTLFDYVAELCAFGAERVECLEKLNDRAGAYELLQILKKLRELRAIGQM